MWVSIFIKPAVTIGPIGLLFCVPLILLAGALDEMDPDYQVRMENKARVEAAHIKAIGEDSVTFPASLGRFPDITPSLVASYGGKCVNGGVYVTYTYSDGKLYEDQIWEPCN